MRILVTGGCGFIGTNFIRLLLSQNEDIHITNLDKLTYAGNPNNLKQFEADKKYSFVHGDICDYSTVERVIKDCEAVVNFAAESHVDRSIESGSEFVRTNFFGAYVMLDAARRSNAAEKFVQISTDEVYGSTLHDPFKEDSAMEPSSPYSASKAGADLLAHSYFVTYGMDVRITRSSNNYGPYQYPEKLIPLFITNLMESKKVPVYGTGKNVRDWIYVEDNCKGILKVLAEGRKGESYNIGGNQEKTNLEVTEIILHEMGKTKDNMKFVEDRKGHDFRYSIDCKKIKTELGWEPTVTFEEGIKKTITWYKDNVNWWKPLKK